MLNLSWIMYQIDLGMARMPLSSLFAWYLPWPAETIIILSLHFYFLNLIQIYHLPFSSLSKSWRTGLEHFPSARQVRLTSIQNSWALMKQISLRTGLVKENRDTRVYFKKLLFPTLPLPEVEEDVSLILTVRTWWGSWK